MTTRLINAADSAYQFPLIIKHIWNTPLLQAQEQEVVYRDAKRFTYGEIWERINRLASALAALGVCPGDTIGVLDWDSNRFLDLFPARCVPLSRPASFPACSSADHPSV